MHTKEYSIDIGGKALTALFSDLAEQAHGSVIIRYGNTAILATAVMSENKKEGLDYFPLSVEYEEKFYAAGAILGSRFIRREGRPTDEAILSGRVVDRTIRPLFEHHIRNEVQVVITVLSIDEDDPDILGIIGASLALGTSNIPWDGPASAVRIAKLGNTYITNPTYKERWSKENEFDLLACGKDGTINMIEIAAKESDEGTLAIALKSSLEEIEILQEFQKKIIAEIGKEKRAIEKPETPEECIVLFREIVEKKINSTLFSGPGSHTLHALKRDWLDEYKEKFPEENTAVADDYFEEAINNALHKAALKDNKRADGRKMDEVRPLYAKAGGISEIIHGSGVFYRGGTHIFSALTLGGPSDSQLIDSIEERDTKKHFIHHYNFPPFSTGETGRIGGANRRMVGHGALAEKALAPVIPPQEKFPYTIRIVSEAFASNGSTSMGSVCGSTLALMDAGVPITRPVAGIAMGLMLSEAKSASGGLEYKILTDIQGPEDHHGDMDFKVAGTKVGVTAIQMDVKVDGVPLSILTEVLEGGKKARLHILEVIEKEISQPRADISPRAPKIITLSVKPEQIGLIIGTGGKTINEIKEKTGVEDISIEDDGTIYIVGKNGTAEKAEEIIKEMTREYTAGEKFTGTVIKILDFGAFVKIGHNTEGLVHISELAPFRVERVEDIVSIGEEVPVIIKEIDEQQRINLSIKKVAPDFAKSKGIMPKK